MDSVPPELCADCGNTPIQLCHNEPIEPKPCPDCRTRKVYFLGLALILTITLSFLSIFYYIEKASSIESYNNLSKDCNSKIAQANRELSKCGSQPTSQVQDRYFFPIMDNMNCSYGVD